MTMSYEERIMVLRDKAADIEVALPIDVADYLASRSDNPNDLKSSLINVASFARQRKRPISMELAQFYLDGVRLEGGIEALPTEVPGQTMLGLDEGPVPAPAPAPAPAPRRPELQHRPATPEARPGPASAPGAAPASAFAPGAAPASAGNTSAGDADLGVPPVPTADQLAAQRLASQRLAAQRRAVEQRLMEEQRLQAERKPQPPSAPALRPEEAYSTLELPLITSDLVADRPAPESAQLEPELASELEPPHPEPAPAPAPASKPEPPQAGFSSFQSEEPWAPDLAELGGEPPELVEPPEFEIGRHFADTPPAPALTQGRDVGRVAFDVPSAPATASAPSGNTFAEDADPGVPPVAATVTRQRLAGHVAPGAPSISGPVSPPASAPTAPPVFTPRPQARPAPAPAPAPASAPGPRAMRTAFVQFAPIRSERKRSMLDRVQILLKRAGIEEVISPGDKVAIKVHFGEQGNTAFVSPIYTREVVRLVKELNASPFVTDANTLYSGMRANAIDHIQCALENGFSYATIGAPIIIADGLDGHDATEVRIDGKHFETVKLGSAAVSADALIVISHVKGHEMAGFGGALKNVGMGLGCRSAKQRMHSGVKPTVQFDKCINCGKCISWCAQHCISTRSFTDGSKSSWIDHKHCVGCGECVAACAYGAIEINWESDAGEFLERMVEHAVGALANKRGKAIYLSFMTNISPDCDCFAMSDAPIVGDIGVLAARDIVAIDQAAYDLITRAPGLPSSRGEGLGVGEDKFQPIHGVEGEHAMIYAENIGLGTRHYELKKVG